jgi:uncharacterized protein with von Willebrand factor type A (vWA) domain
MFKKAEIIVNTLLEASLSADYEQYTALMARMKQCLAAKDFDGFYQLQTQTEQIKNRNGGMPPSPPGAVPTAPAQ